MYLREHTQICVLHAISPVHAGAGSATGAVDLPIQRESHTGWPHIQSSGVKGAFRDHCERFWTLKDLSISGLRKKGKTDQAKELTERIFGKSSENSSQAGAIAFSDAKLMAFPVRSNLAPFVWVVSPTLLKRLGRDLTLANIKTEYNDDKSRVGKDQYILIKGDLKGALILEDICLEKQEDQGQNELATKVSKLFDQLVSSVERLVLVSDEHFSYLMETATEIQAQINIDSATGTTKDGSLRYQELLPADSVLYTVTFFGDERAEDNALILNTLKSAVKEAVSTHIQIGGDMTLGRGIFEISWYQKGGKNE